MITISYSTYLLFRRPSSLGNPTKSCPVVQVIESAGRGKGGKGKQHLEIRILISSLFYRFKIEKSWNCFNKRNSQRPRKTSFKIWEKHHDIWLVAHIGWKCNSQPWPRAWTWSWWSGAKCGKERMKSDNVERLKYSNVLINQT